MAAIRFWILDFGIWIAAPWDFGMGIWKIEIGIDPFHASAFDTDSDFDLDKLELPMRCRGEIPEHWTFDLGHRTSDFGHCTF